MMGGIDLGLAASPNALAAAAGRFATDGHVRLAEAFVPETAAALHRHLAEDLDWSRVVNQGEKTWDLGPASIEAMEKDGDGSLHEAVNRGARHGFQFLFDSVRVSDDSSERRARGLLLDRLLESLNGPEWLSAFRKLTGRDDIARVDGQATRYLPGHFLTGHDDGIEGKDRIAAYVINLTPEWRTEWGGILLFHD